MRPTSCCAASGDFSQQQYFQIPEKIQNLSVLVRSKLRQSRVVTVRGQNHQQPVFNEQTGRCGPDLRG